MRALVAACLLAAAAPPWAQASAEAAAYPARPVRLVVPAAPGGGTDIIARLIAQGLTERWGQQVVVDNRGGGGGVIGVPIVIKAAPDGHTMLLGSNGHLTFAPAVYRKPPYDPRRDLSPITLAAAQPFIVAVHPGLEAASMKEFIALARSRPGQLRFGSGGSGGASHLGVGLLQTMAGVRFVHVPYKGTGPAMAALAAGEVHLVAAGVETVMPHARAGRVRALAVTGAKRVATVPELPTVAESGVPGYEFDVWYGLAFPAATPRAIVEKANADAVQALKSAALAQRLRAAGIEPVASSAAEFGEIIRREIPKWEKVVRALGWSAD